MKSNKKLLFLPFIAAILIGALWTSLERLGWSLPGWNGGLLKHGQLMIPGFLGSLISLERSVALQKKWTFFAPILFATGTILSLIPEFLIAGYMLLILASLIFVVTMIYLVKMQTTNFNIVMALSSVLLLTGNILWYLGDQIPQVIFYWIGFLALTILGERLELTRMLPIKNWQKWIVHSLIFFSFLSIIMTSFYPQIGAKIFGGVSIALAIWFILYDIARKTVKMRGQPKFTAIGLLLGYFWLIVSGMFLLIYGNSYAGLEYDAFTHAIFLGFVFGMIFVHAPIIFPAVFGKPFSFSKRFYSHLWLLQITLAGRVFADFMINAELRMWFGLLNVLTILLFLGNTIASVILEKK